jgi:hypothetical protein
LLDVASLVSRQPIDEVRHRSLSSPSAVDYDGASRPLAARHPAQQLQETLALSQEGA